MYAVDVGEMIKSLQRHREIGEMKYPISEYSSYGWQSLIVYFKITGR